MGRRTGLLASDACPSVPRPDRRMVTGSRPGSLSASWSSRPCSPTSSCGEASAASGSFFGDDLYAYTQRRRPTRRHGVAVRSGPARGADREPSENILIGYFYPPVLAQLFLPLRAIPHIPLALGWSIAQAICLLILLPLISWRLVHLLEPRAAWRSDSRSPSIPSNSRSSVETSAAGWRSASPCRWLQALASEGSSRPSRPASSSCPFRMFFAALTDARSRITAVIPLAVIVAVSVVLAPQAWLDFIKVLPNILRNGMADSRTNLRPPTRSPNSASIHWAWSSAGRWRSDSGRPQWHRDPRGILEPRRSRWPSSRSRSLHRPCGITTSPFSSHSSCGPGRPPGHASAPRSRHSSSLPAASGSDSMRVPGIPPRPCCLAHPLQSCHRRTQLRVASQRMLLAYGT